MKEMKTSNNNNSLNTKKGPVFHMTLATVTGNYPTDELVLKLKNQNYGTMKVCWFLLSSDDADPDKTGLSFAEDCL